MTEFSRVVKIASNTIRLEVESLNSLQKSIGKDFYQIIKLIQKSEGKVILCGLGKSGIIATKIAATLNSTGTTAVFVHASDASHGDIGVLQKNDIIIFVSKSGNTKEINDLIPALKKNGNKIIGMTSNKSSSLAKKSDYILFNTVEREACNFNLAPTTSTTNQLVLGDALAMSLMNLNNFQPKNFAELHPSGNLGRRLNLIVKDLINYDMRPKVSCSTKMKDVIVEISKKRLGATVVLDKGKIVGIITDGDIRRLLEKYDNLNKLYASKIMTKNPFMVNEKFKAINALEIMKKNKINHLIVIGDKINYIGIIHVLDFLKEGFN